MILIFAASLVLLRLFYSVAEMAFERDWPRRTWRGLALAFILLVLCCSAFAQEVRVDVPLQTLGPNVPSTAGPLPQALWEANATAYLCTHPSATLSYCQAHPLATYTDSTGAVACPSATQLVQLPGNACTASTGAAANIGAWYAGGLFDYWVATSYGIYGPFTAGYTVSGVNGQIITPSQSQPGVSPYADLRVYGAVIDGATDITSALNAAIATQCPGSSVTGGSGCTVLLPCTGKGCYLANGSAIVNGWGTGVLVIKLQGSLYLGSTLVQPTETTIMGDGGCYPTQYQTSGATACIYGPGAKGTMGTAITTTGTPVSFTPTFAAGSIGNLQVNSAITVAGLETCTMSASRTTGGVVTLTSSACTDSSSNSTGMRMPAETNVTVSSCSDTSFNGSGLTIVHADYPAGTLIINTSDTTASTATGCSVAGFNENTFENVRISGVSGSTVSAAFAHPHAASDIWGEVAMASTSNGFEHNDLENIAVYGTGTAYWGDSYAFLNFENDAFSASQYMASSAFELDGAWWGSIKKSSFYNGTWRGGQPSYPYSIRLSQDAYGSNGIAGDFMSLSDSTLEGGIKMDGNGMANTQCCTTVPNMRDLVVEYPADAMLMIDNRYSLGNDTMQVLEDNVFPQDCEFLANCTYTARVGYTDANIDNNVDVDLGRVALSPEAIMLTNKYFSGELKSNGIINGLPWPSGRYAPPGVFAANGEIDAEWFGADSGLGPSLIPYPTLATSTASCSTCTSVNGPGGTSGGVSVASTSGSGVIVGVGNYSGPTYVGDQFLLWSWTLGPGATAFSYTGQYPPFTLHTYGTDAIAAPQYGIDLSAYRWTPNVALETVTVGDSTSHSVQFWLESPSPGGAANSFWNWGWMYIPASANIPEAEVERWRQYLLHGAPPQGFSGTGRAATSIPVVAPEFDVLTPSTGAYAPFATGNLADWTNGSASVNDVATCTAVTSGKCTAWAAEASGVAANAFSNITSGTNTTASMTVGSGGSLGTTGSGAISANQLNGVPFCTGFTPTNAQYLQYTTSSSPNPCYTAASPSGSGNTTSTSLTTYYMPEANGANSIINSPFYDTNPTSTPTGLGGMSSLTMLADSTYTNWISMTGNTTLPAILSSSHRFYFLGPATTSFSSFGWQFPSGANSSPGLLHLGAASGSVSQLSVSLVAPSDLATQSADTMLANMTASTASPTAVAIPTTAHGVWLGEGTATAPGITAAGAADTVLLGQGSSSDPIFGTVTHSYVDSSVVTDSGNTTATANQVGVSTGTAGAMKFIDYPAPYSVPAANCVGGAGGAAWSTTLTAGCRAGTNNLGGYLPFSDGSTAQFALEIPSDWDTATNPYVKLIFTSGANTSGTMIFNVAISCYATNNSATDDESFQTAQTFSTITATNANYASTVSLQLNNTSVTGCTAGGMMIVKVTRATDTAANPVSVIEAVVTIPRLITLQAN